MSREILKKAIETSIIWLYYFILGLVVLVFCGFVLDIIFLTLGEPTGAFSKMINFMRYIAPGATKVWKLLLDIVYAIAFATFQAFTLPRESHQ